MSDNSIWGKTYRRFVENGYDQGYAAYRADEAERELSRKAKKGDVARLIGDHIADKNDVIEKLRAENERLRVLVQCLIDNDPNADAADGVTVLDVWRKEAQALLATAAGEGG